MIDLSSLDGTIRVQVNEWNRSLKTWLEVEADLRAEGKSVTQLRGKIIENLRKNGHLGART